MQRRARRLRFETGRGKRLAEIEAGQPTPEQLGRNVYQLAQIKEPGKAQARLALRNCSAMAIDRYLHRGWLTEAQHAAARRYRDCYDLCGFERPIVGRYDGGGGSSANGPNMAGLMAATLGQIDARASFRAARAALPQSLAPRFDKMVLHEDEAAAVGEAHGRTGAMAAKFAIEWLRLGCDELAAFYKI